MEDSKQATNNKMWIIKLRNLLMEDSKQATNNKMWISKLSNLLKEIQNNQQMIKYESVNWRKF